MISTMTQMYVGIDPSLNSTGVVVRVYSGAEDTNPYTHMYIIKPNKLSKKEKDAEERHTDLFSYVTYEKVVSHDGDTYNDIEVAKTTNFMMIVDAILYIVQCEMHTHNVNEECVHVCQEGISYGSSIKTRSVFDLAGLNFMIRNAFMRYPDISYTISSPSEIKKYATSKGNATKDLMVKMFRVYYPNLILPKIDDVVDAYFMAEYAHENTM